MHNDRTSFIRTVSFCAGLPDSAIAALSAIAIPLQRPAGGFIQLEGDPADVMYLVIRGRVKIARTSASGREQVLNVIGAGGHFNTVPMFDGGTWRSMIWRCWRCRAIGCCTCWSSSRRWR